MAKLLEFRRVVFRSPGEGRERAQLAGSGVRACEGMGRWTHGARMLRGGWPVAEIGRASCRERAWRSCAVEDEEENGAQDHTVGHKLINIHLWLGSV